MGYKVYFYHEIKSKKPQFEVMNFSRNLLKVIQSILQDLSSLLP